MDDFGYLQEYGWPSEEAAGGRYMDYGAAPQTGQHRGPWQPDYAAPGPQGVPQHLPDNGWRVPDHPPQGAGNGGAYPPSPTCPMPMYRPPNGGPVQGQGYPPPGYVPAPPYQPYGYPVPTYRPEDSGPMPPYQPPNDRRAPGSPRTSTALLSDYPISEPIPTYQPPAGYRPRPSRPAAERSPVSGREILGWLPFGSRLVLLPKEPVADGEELREHRDVSDGWLRPAVFGAMDGLVTNVSLIAGVGAGAGGGAKGMIVLTGIAGLVAGAFSMATGEYISVSSQNELNLAEVELERKQHARDPEGKLWRLAHLFVEKGVSPNLAEAVVRQISAEPERAISEHLRQELGIDPDDLPSPRTAAFASLASFTVGALIPLSPFLVGYPVLKVALVLSGAAAFIGGAAVAKLTGRSMFVGGMRQFVAAALGAGAAFFIGHAIGGHIS